jgi:hypothetical protein
MKSIGSHETKKIVVQFIDISDKMLYNEIRAE